jgi:4-amino-4-deoxy-L-arabinose transferase-like glycosyltransferase
VAFSWAPFNVDPRKYCPICITIFALLLFFPGLGAWDFWAPVEPRYGEIARVMFARGEWIVPMVNGEVYTDKSILYFWIVLAAAKILGGVTEWTVRLPAALGGVGFVLATYFFGRDFFNARVGAITAIVLATSFRVMWESAGPTSIWFLFFSSYLRFTLARGRFLRRGGPSRELRSAFGKGKASRLRPASSAWSGAAFARCFIAISNRPSAG